MRSEKGVTLVSLVTIIVIIIILASLAIYTGVNSYQVVDIQKFKSQLQMIQNEVDELYEKNKNDLAKGKEIEKYKNLKVSEIYNEGDTQRAKILKEFWDNIASKFGINATDEKTKEKYYLFSAAYIESEFGLSDIDISEYFIINLEKRYVFSITPITLVTGKDKDGDITEDIYCLYQLDEEEKVIDLKQDSDYEYSITKEDYKQTIEITHDINIEKIEIEITRSEVNDAGETTNVVEYVDINSRKDYCTKVSGLGTGTVNIEIIKDCTIKITDTLGKEEPKEFRLYNTPVLKDNMIPFIPTKVVDDTGTEVNEGIICYQNSPDWYDYNDSENIKFATAVMVSNNSITTYKENISDTSRTIFKINDLQVKVWIPKNLNMPYLEGELFKKYGFYDEESWYEDVTGIWVDAEYKEITDTDGNKIKDENGKVIKRYIPIEYQ